MGKKALGWESALGPLSPILVHLQGHWIQAGQPTSRQVSKS